MLLLRMNGDELSDQSAWPVIESDMASDTGALQAYFPAVPESPVNMVVAGHEGCIFAACLRIDASESFSSDPFPPDGISTGGVGSL